MHQDAYAAGHGAFDRDLLGTEQRRVRQPQRARRGGRKVGPQVGRRREEDAHDVVDVESVPVEQLREQLLSARLDVVPRVGVDGGRAAQSYQPGPLVVGHRRLRSCQ